MNKSQRVIVEAAKKGYRVTKNGRVVSSRGTIRKLYVHKRKPGSGGRTRPSYYKFSVNVKGSKNSVSIEVHKLAAYQKFGEISFEKGVQVRHMNNDSLDNSLSNIQLGNQSQNSRDKAECRFSDADIMQMIKERARGISYAEIARRHSVKHGTVVWKMLNQTKYVQVIRERMAG